MKHYVETCGVIKTYYGEYANECNSTTKIQNTTCEKCIAKMEKVLAIY